MPAPFPVLRRPTLSTLIWPLLVQGQDPDRLQLDAVGRLLPLLERVSGRIRRAFRVEDRQGQLLGCHVVLPIHRISRVPERFQMAALPRWNHRRRRPGSKRPPNWVNLASRG